MVPKYPPQGELKPSKLVAVEPHPCLGLGGQGPVGVLVQEVSSGDFGLAGFPEELVTWAYDSPG